MAYKPQSFIENLFSDYDFEKYTTHTIDNFQDLEMELKKIKEQGYAIDDEENLDGNRCVAMPVRDYTEKIVASISVSAPASRMPLDRIQKIVEELAPACRKLSIRLGYRGQS